METVAEFEAAIRQPKNFVKHNDWRPAFFTPEVEASLVTARKPATLPKSAWVINASANGIAMVCASGGHAHTRDAQG